MVVFCAAIAAFAYSLGKQSGEREARDGFERSLTEQRMAAVLNSDPDLYMGDEYFEHDSYVHPVTPQVEEPAPTAEAFVNPD